MIIQNTTELHTKWRLVWHVNYISMKLLIKTKIKRRRDNIRLDFQELSRLESSPKGLRLALVAKPVALSRACSVVKDQRSLCLPMAVAFHLTMLWKQRGLLPTTKTHRPTVQGMEVRGNVSWIITLNGLL